MMRETDHGENKKTKALAKTPKIKPGSINADAYFLSLADAALEAGLLTDCDMEGIQMQIFDILAENIRMFTKGESDSVSSKEANELISAILYVLDSFCLRETGAGENSSDDLAEIFKEKGGIKKCYEKGLKILNKRSAKDIDMFAGEIKYIFDLSGEVLDSEEFKAFDKSQKETGINNVSPLSEMTAEEYLTEFIENNKNS
jgi:hypothetical protein